MSAEANGGVQGNATQSRRGGTGSGYVKQKAPFGLIQVNGKGGDIKYVSTAGLFLHPGRVYQGLYAQALKGGVVIAATLVPADLACDPKQDGPGNFWMTDTTLALNTGAALAHKLATALKITFSADATVFIAGA